MTEVSWWQARTLAGEAMGGSSGEVVPLAVVRSDASDVRGGELLEKLHGGRVVEAPPR